MTTSLLEPAVGREWPYKGFMTHLHERKLLDVRIKPGQDHIMYAIQPYWKASALDSYFTMDTVEHRHRIPFRIIESFTV